MLGALGTEAVERDLGITDQYQTYLINKMLDRGGSNTADKLLGMMLEVVRWDMASRRTLQNIKKLSAWKQSLINLLSFRVLVHVEHQRFRDAFKKIRDNSVRLSLLQLRLPFARTKNAKREYVRQFRKLL